MLLCPQLDGGSSGDGGHSWPVDVFVNAEVSGFKQTVILKGWPSSVFSLLSTTNLHPNIITTFYTPCPVRISIHQSIVWFVLHSSGQADWDNLTLAHFLHVSTLSQCSLKSCIKQEWERISFPKLHQLVSSVPKLLFIQNKTLWWSSQGCGWTQLDEYHCLVSGSWLGSNNSFREALYKSVFEYFSCPSGAVSRQHDVVWGTKQHNSWSKLKTA